MDLDARTGATDASPESFRQPTTQLVFRGNLSADEIHTWDSIDPRGTANLAYRFDTIDGTAAKLPMTVYFVRETPPFHLLASTSSCWGYHALVPHRDFPEQSGDELGGGRLCFDLLGRLMENTPLGIGSFADGGTTGPIVFDFGSATVDGGNGDNGVTGYVGPSLMTGILVRPDPGGAFPECIPLPEGPRLSPNCIPKPCPTSMIHVYGNLDPTAPTKAWDTNHLLDSANLVQQFTVETSLGERVPVALYLSRLDRPADGSAGNSVEFGLWSYHLICDGKYLTGSMENIPVVIAEGELAFDRNGRLASNSQYVNDFSPRRSTSQQSLALNFGYGTLNGGAGPAYIFAMPGPSVISRVDIDTCINPATRP